MQINPSFRGERQEEGGAHSINFPGRGGPSRRLEPDRQGTFWRGFHLAGAAVDDALASKRDDAVGCPSRLFTLPAGTYAISFSIIEIDLTFTI